MNNKLENLLYDFIRDNEIATEKEIDLVTNINGYNEEALNDIIWCRTGYHDAEQCYDCEPENYYLSEELKDYYGLTEDEDEDEEDGEIPEDYPDPDYDLVCESNRAETEYFNR